MPMAEEGPVEEGPTEEVPVEEGPTEKPAGRDRDAGQLDYLKSELLAIVSHELRTPLNAIMGFTSILADGLAGPVSTTQQSYLERIQQASEHLLGLIDDLLDFGRIRAGKLTLERQAVSLSQLMTAMLVEVNAMAARKRQRIQLRVSEAIPAIDIDPARIRQVMRILVGNAVKFTPEEGNIEIRLEKTRDGVRVTVSDTGIGIAPDAIAKLFRPLSQIDMSSTRSFGGAGIGLSLAKGLVEAHGGSIGVDSRPQQGASFWFLLPLSEATQADPGSA